MNINLDTLTLEIFIAIADTKSFSAASEIVGRTQPAISLQIKKLENQFGCKFFERNGNKIYLTQNGEIFLSYATNIIKSQLELNSILLKNKKSSVLKIGIAEDIATIYLADILKSFHAFYPNIELEITCDLSLNIFKGFNANLYDTAIIKNDQESMINNDSQIEVWKEPLLWVANKNYILNNIIPLITSPEPCIYRARSINVLNQNNIKWKIQYTTHSLSGKIAALDAGFGIAVLPSKIIEKYDFLKDIGTKFNLPNLDDFKISIFKNRKSDQELVDVFSKHVIYGISNY